MKRWGRFFVVALCWWAQSAVADQYHYNNIIMGDRAIGLGGAYAAIADDASGLVYNPAGLAFALSNDISGSANAFYNRKVIYKETLGSDDFKEESNGSLPSFFGGLQKLDRYVPGLVAAFGMYTTDSDLKDQDDLIENKTIGNTTIRRFHRTTNHRASTFFAGAGVGYRITPNFSVGFALQYFAVDELVQEYQDGKQNNVGGDQSIWRILTQNVRQRLLVSGMEPSLGVQYAFLGNFSVGLNIKKGLIASQNMEISTETRQLFTDSDQISGNSSLGIAGVGENINEEKNDNPLGSWPMSLRLGFAWFASTSFLLAFDVTHYTAVTDAGGLESFTNAAGEKKKLFEKEAVTNFSLGTEYYIIPSIPLRFGLFTNNDARPELKEKDPYTAGDGTSINCAANTTSEGKDYINTYCAQPDHIDYIGESLFIAWVQPNSQISAGVVLQQGKGKAQKLGDHQVQDVEASATTLGFSATHNF